MGSRADEGEDERLPLVKPVLVGQFDSSNGQAIATCGIRSSSRCARTRMLAKSGWNRLGQNRAVGGEDKWPVKDTASKRDSVTCSRNRIP